jgi:enoyl-CoA hydratase/carnithine racemase
MSENAKLVGSGLILLDERDGFNVITLNRPEKRNAMNLAIQGDLREALDRSRGAKVVVLTGAAPTFCAGIDLDEQRQLRAAATPVPSQNGHPWAVTQEIIRRHPAVLIAAVSGAALGGGLTLVHNCDLAVADEKAQFGVPELTFGTVPALSGPATVKRLLPKHAAHMIFLAQRVDAATALRFGIVNEVVPVGEAVSRAIEMAEVIAGYDRVAIDYSKKLFRDTQDMGWSEAIDQGVELGSLSRAERQRLETNAGNDEKGGG